MNKQLAELAAKSGFDVGIHNGLILGKFSDMYKLDKFAELIVRKCIDIAQDRANFPDFPPNDVNDIIDEIREHFGVEE